jgi:murein DD-endopeptidase MepM/ murein hydrolase activator NlpD
MSLLGEHVTARQVISVSTTMRAGDHEVVRVRPFVRIATNLALAPSALAANVPPFNPVKLMADADTDRGGDETPQAEPTGDLTITMRDLAQLPPNTRTVGSVRSDDILMKLREAVEVSSDSGGKAIAALTKPGFSNQFGGHLAYAAEGSIPFSLGNIPAVAENMSTMAKTANEATGGNNWTERTLIVKKGVNVASMLRSIGAESSDLKGLLASFGPRGRDNGLKDGQRVRILLSPGPNGTVTPVRVSIFSDQAHEASVALSDNGHYVAVEDPHDSSFAKMADEDDGDDGKGIRLYQSIYETALKNQVPVPMIDSIIRTFSFDVDMQRRVRAGDSVDILYANDETDSGDVLYASINVGGEPRRYYRFQTEDDGITDYYDEAGKSAKKFLVRKPLAGGIFRSGFGARNHPILGFTRMHTGVDWADDIGTPVFAAGNGTVIDADWKGGYGRHIEIQHLNGYVTTYSHLSGYAHGIEGGVKVRQGQVIGYIGNTGLSTGPHLHYEVKINGTFVDPMRIKLPRGRELDGTVLAKFERERTRIDRILGNTPASPRTAQLSNNQ